MRLLSSCADLDQESVRLGKQIHGYVMRIKTILTTTLGTTLLDMYGKAGHFDMALTIFHQIWIKIYTRNAIISALASNGRPEKALEMFEMMKSKNVHPNGITLLAVLTACARSKLVDLGYPAIHFPYVVSTRSLQHQSFTVCMVDLIGRAGVLVDVVSFIKNGSFIKNLPFKPNASVLKALLSACKIHEDVELDNNNKVGKWLIRLQPQHCGQYVALSTLNAMKSNWAEAEQIRKVIIKAGIRKIPAQSVRCFKA